jgi:hypothetical protein
MISSDMMFIAKMMVFAAIASVFYLVGKIGFGHYGSRVRHAKLEQHPMLTHMTIETGVKMFLVMFAAFMVLELEYIASIGGFGGGVPLDGTTFYYYIVIGLALYTPADIWMNKWLWQGNLPKSNDNILLIFGALAFEIVTLIGIMITLDRALQGNLSMLIFGSIMYGFDILIGSLGISLAITLSFMHQPTAPVICSEGAAEN